MNTLTKSRTFPALTRALTAAVLLSVGAPALAVPALQLWSEDGVWDRDLKGWVVDAPDGAFSVTALATDKHHGSRRGNAFDGVDTQAFLVFAVVGDFAASTANLLGDITVDGTLIDDPWNFGRPSVGGDRLPAQGTYATWFKSVAFDFGGFGADVFETKGNSGRYLDVRDEGFRRDFATEVSGFGPLAGDNLHLHIDVYTRDDDGGLYRFSPNSRDLDIYLPSGSTVTTGDAEGVPTPGMWAVLLTVFAGLVLAARVRRARRGDASA